MEAGNLIYEAYRQGLRKGGCESSGHNVSERTGGLESVLRRPSPQPMGEGSMGGRKLIDTTDPLRRGGSDGTMTRTHRATGEALLAPVRNGRSKVDAITGGTGKGIEGERVAEGRVVALRERQANWLGYSGCKSRVMKLKLGTYPREPCVATREGGHEASVAVCVARDIEHRKVHSLGRRGFLQGRRQHVRHRYGETANRPTVSKTPWTHIRILPGPGRSATRPAIVRGRNGKALAP